MGQMSICMPKIPRSINNLPIKFPTLKNREFSKRFREKLAANSEKARALATEDLFTFKSQLAPFTQPVIGSTPEHRRLIDSTAFSVPRHVVHKMIPDEVGKRSRTPGSDGNVLSF